MICNVGDPMSLRHPVSQDLWDCLKTISRVLCYEIVMGQESSLVLRESRVWRSLCLSVETREFCCLKKTSCLKIFCLKRVLLRQTIYNDKTFSWDKSLPCIFSVGSMQIVYMYKRMDKRFMKTRHSLETRSLVSRDCQETREFSCLKRMSLSLYLFSLETREFFWDKRFIKTFSWDKSLSCMFSLYTHKSDLRESNRKSSDVYIYRVCVNNNRSLVYILYWISINSLYVQEILLYILCC